jgi:hypothetical protein
MNINRVILLNFIYHSDTMTCNNKIIRDDDDDNRVTSITDQLQQRIVEFSSKSLNDSPGRNHRTVPPSGGKNL